MLQECFNPIVDAASGRDLIPAMVYGYETPFKAFVSSCFSVQFLFSFFPLSHLMYLI